jgi:transporter family protein
MLEQRWLIYALLSALAAALVSIFGKIGMKEVDSNLATTVRSVIMTVFLLGCCTVMGVWSKASTLTSKAMAMIALSGVAGAVSWLFYFKAIQVGQVSKVAPVDKLSMPLAVVLAVVMLGEKPGMWNWVGVGLIAIGGYLTALSES